MINGIEERIQFDDSISEGYSLEGMEFELDKDYRKSWF